MKMIACDYSIPAVSSAATTRCVTGWALAGSLFLLAQAAVAGPPPLPEARANNPVALLTGESGGIWFTGLGLTGGKTWQDLRADGWVWRSGQADWQKVPALPPFEGLAGRLGSHAVVVDGGIHVIGGYTVAADHAERSTPGIWRLELSPEVAWSQVTVMPVPVDDSVALVLDKRHVYLISGWSDTGNVNLVQVWDSADDNWVQGEPWPGAPVFGHAGGLVDGRMVICGGARVVYPPQGARQFVASEECWLGSIRDDDRRRLDWKPLPAMPGGPRYRAGAVAAVIDGTPRVIFAGGADRPYNYDGIGYDGVPATALTSVISYNLDQGGWECHEPMPEARMDLRGLVLEDRTLAVIGGMDDRREVRADSVRWPLSRAAACNPGAASQHIPEQSVPDSRNPSPTIPGGH